MHLMIEPEWVHWSILAILFLAGVGVTIAAFVMDDVMVDDNGGKILGCFIMAVVLIFGIWSYIDKQSVISGENEKELIAEKDEMLERAETDRRMDLISEKLELDESEIIVYATENDLFNAETSKGKYLIEFNEAYEEILKIIKTSD